MLEVDRRLRWCFFRGGDAPDVRSDVESESIQSATRVLWLVVVVLFIMEKVCTHNSKPNVSAGGGG